MIRMRNELVLLNSTGGILPEGISRKTLFVREENRMQEVIDQSIKKKIDPVAIIKRLEANTKNKNM